MSKPKPLDTVRCYYCKKPTDRATGYCCREHEEARQTEVFGSPLREQGRAPLYFAHDKKRARDFIARYERLMNRKVTA